MIRLLLIAVAWTALSIPVAMLCSAMCSAGLMDDDNKKG